MVLGGENRAPGAARLMTTDLINVAGVHRAPAYPASEHRAEKEEQEVSKRSLKKHIEEKKDINKRGSPLRSRSMELHISDKNAGSGRCGGEHVCGGTGARYLLRIMPLSVPRWSWVGVNKTIMKWAKEWFWVSVLYNFDIQSVNIRSRENVICDALSRWNDISSTSRIGAVDPDGMLWCSYLFR